MTPCELINLTIPIQAENGTERGNATSFIVQYKSQHYLITNRHVVENRPHIILKIKAEDEFSEQINVNTIFTIDAKNYFDDTYDLCAIPIGNVLTNYEVSKRKIINTIIRLDELTKQYPDFLDIEDVVIVGYPNLFHDEVNNFPIVLSGITSTSVNIDYNGRRCFLINASEYHGSSGSPVFIRRGSEYYLVGISYGTTPYNHKINHIDDTTDSYISSYKIEEDSRITNVIKISVLIDLIKSFQQ